MDYFNLEAEGIKPNSMQRRALKELRRNRDLGIKQAFLISSTGSGYTSFAYNIGAGGLISGVYTFFTRNTGSYLGKICFWILIILIVIIVQAIQELGLYIAKK